MRFLLLVLLMAIGVGSVHSADLPRSKPEAQGVSSAALLSFIETADAKIDSLHSFVMVRHGHVIAEGWWTPYNAETRHQLYSLSKSFTSTAVGLAIAEGKLKLDDELVKLFPDDVPANPSANLKSMRISDLLRMNTGHQTEPPRKADEAWTKTFLNHPVPFKPGTHFLYNTPATYMQSAAVQKATGKTVLDYLTPRLFEPLGIKDPTWETSPQGISTGGYGLSIRTEDIAKFGQLYLQKGKWGDKQLVPKEWVEEATARQTSNGSNPKSDWDQGYGYQFWRSRNGAYRGDGAFGQYCIVLPEQDTVIAITGGVKDMQAVLNLVWDKLLPAMNTKALPADEGTNTKLVKTLKGLTLKHPETKGKPAQVIGKEFKFPKNDRKLESMMIEANDKDAVTIVTRIDGKDRKISIGNGTWLRGKSAWGLSATEQPTASSGAWTADDTYTAKICFTETPFIVTLKLKFTGNELKYEAESNVGFGQTKEPTLTGKGE
jgi:CubicO group peptidase (beta-lactamase class C family)